MAVEPRMYMLVSGLCYIVEILGYGGEGAGVVWCQQ